jgi:hypothetical protein
LGAECFAERKEGKLVCWAVTDALAEDYVDNIGRQEVRRFAESRTDYSAQKKEGRDIVRLPENAMETNPGSPRYRFLELETEYAST